MPTAFLLFTIAGGIFSPAALADTFPPAHILFLEDLSIGTRALAMGGAFAAAGDDPSILFLNPAGMTVAAIPSAYIDYGNFEKKPSLSQMHVSIVAPLNRFSAGAGFYRRRMVGGMRESTLMTGVSCRIARGTEGSFLSVGGGLRIATVSADGPEHCVSCGSGRVSRTKAAASFGMMIRPLPMISIAYSIENPWEPEFDLSVETGVMGRIQHWGISWFWNDKLTVSWERRHERNGDGDHFGFSMRTALPVDIMAGFSQEKVSGGIRCEWERLRLSISFSPDDEMGIYTAFSMEIFLRKPGE